MIEADKRKAIFLLHQEGMSKREIARRLGMGTKTVCRIIALAGQMPVACATVPPVDAGLLRRLFEQCDGYVQRVHEKLLEEHGHSVKYSTLTRWLRKLGINAPPASTRCEHVPDQPGAAMQHDTSPYVILLNGVPTKLQASLLYLRYSKRRYLVFYRVFDRFKMKCFLHGALLHWGYAAGICVIDNTNLARWRGLGSNAVMVPEMEAFAKARGFRFLCHAPKHPDRKAGEERSFWTLETNFLPGRSFQDMEDLNRQALEWSTVRLEQRPQGRAGLIPAQAFEHERLFLQALPPHMPAPYMILERSVDEYGYVAVLANHYEMPGTGRGTVQVLLYETHLQIHQSGQCLVDYPLVRDGLRQQACPLPEGRSPQHQPRHRQRRSDLEEKRLRALVEVLRCTNAQPDPQDPHKWHTAQGVLSLNGPKFMNWTRGAGGGGAIDLVMHLYPLGFGGALDWLELHLGPVDVQGPAPPFQPPSNLLLPTPVPKNLDRVLAYLIQERRLPPPLLQPLLRSGTLYADARANAVFLLRGERGQPVGAELRGTTHTSSWRGMAPGSRKDLGFFSIPEQPSQACVLCESAIDAISWHALHPPYRCISTSGARPDAPWLTQLLNQPPPILCGFDLDPTGEAMASALISRHPAVRRLRPPPIDWNDFLRLGP